MNSFRRGLPIDIRRLRVLRELQTRGTLAATAEALHLTPSAISQQIAALSQELGVPLIVPHGRRVRLSPQAILLLDRAIVIDAELERARADLAAFEAGAAGHVVVGAFATAIVGIITPTIVELRRDAPGIQVSVFESEAPECLLRLDSGELDLAVTVDYRDGPTHGDLRYCREELLDDPLVVVMGTDTPYAGQSSIDLKALAGESWIVGAVRGPCQEVGLSACASAGFRPCIVHHVNDWSALFALVAARCGVALVPRMAIPHQKPSGIAVRPLKGSQQPGRHIYTAIRAGAEKHPSLAVVLAALHRAADGHRRALTRRLR